MANLYVNKVVQSNGTTLIDITDTTAVAEDVAQGKYFYLSSGEKVEGTASGGGVDRLPDIVSGTISGDIELSVTKLKRMAFSNCPNITSISLPNITELGSDIVNVFDACGATSYYLPLLKNAPGTNFFYGCKAPLLELPSIETIGASCFLNSTAIIHLYMPKLKTFNSNSFKNTRFSEIAFPSLTTAARYAFEDNTNLTICDFGPNCQTIAEGCFNRCTAFNTLILRRASVTTLGNVNAFGGTPFASGGIGGTLYVPSALIASYQAASNWSTILGYTNNQIKSIESTHTDPNAPIDLTLYYADGTPIPTT